MLTASLLLQALKFVTVTAFTAYSDYKAVSFGTLLKKISLSMTLSDKTSNFSG